ncbi:MAG TPA: sugar ABC transporter permease [Candidatus Limnocylindrales bacterium]|nr:sugar ABC transporter permease [Candidatus Limnocylindrales bacterium]
MRRDLRYGLFFTSPAIAFFLLFWILPVLLALYYSLTRWKVGRPATFIGLKNYIDLFTDPQFHQSVKASVVITLLVVTGTLVLSLLLAVLLNDDRLRGSHLIKALIILPVVTDWVATGLVWQLIFLPYSGVLAGIFSFLGLYNFMGLGWTATKSLAPFAIVIFIIWKTTGLYTIIFLAGLKGIPRQYTEAAIVDGANARQVFFNITLPLLRPITVFVLVTAFVSTMGLFEPVFMLTGGGPADATRVLPIFLYENFFQFRNGGYASAAGVLFLIFCLGFALISARILRYSYYE